jgi:23S rRNA (uracil1939-C5)-methyltransferase
MPLIQKGEELRLEIQSAAFEGTSVARHEGLVVFVEGAVPGDIVRARVSRVKKSHADAYVVSVERPSPLRVVPRCPHFGVCGGCRWQHVGYAAQLEFKRQHVVDAFERIGGFEHPEVFPVIGSDAQYFYRNKMEYSFSDRQWFDTRHPEWYVPPPGEELPSVFLGLHVTQRYEKVLDIAECHLQSDLSNRILRFTRAFVRRRRLSVHIPQRDEGYLRFLVIRQSARTAEVMVNLVTFDDRPDLLQEFAAELRAECPEVTTVVNTINRTKAQIASGEETRIVFGPGVIRERLGKFTFEISAGSFFQTNTAQAERLYGVAEAFAELNGGETVYDLYSGTGSIALFVSERAGRVVGVEAVESSIRDAERNVRLNGVRNCTFVLGDLKDRLTRDAGWMAAHPRPDVLIIDPPRSGMHPKVVEEIVRLRVPRLVYVSCNPSTQARDVKLLCLDTYRLVKLQPVDMFPHTYHIENVCQLVLK